MMEQVKIKYSGQIALDVPQVENGTATVAVRGTAVHKNGQETVQ